MNNIVARDPMEVAWAAGFLDGEGHFGIGRGGRGGRHLRVVLEAAQVATREPLDRLQRLFGGNVREGKSAWRWTLSGRDAVLTALLVLCPLLSVKGEAARLVGAFAQFTRPTSEATGRAYTPEEAQMREALRGELLQLQGRNK